MSQESQPLVSIVIPCYNHAEFVQDCIRSVIDQTYQNIELIIIDDGSKDNSVEKIQELFNQCKARFTRFEFRYRPNSGLSSTLNEALGWCRGEFFSAIASDDKLIETKIVTQIKLFSDFPDAKAIFGKVNLIDENNNFLGVAGSGFKKMDFDDFFLRNETVYAPTQFFKLQCIKSIGYKNGFILEDWYILLKLLADGGYVIQSDDIYSFYRFHTNNTSKNKYKMLLGGIQVYNEFLGHEKIDDKFMLIGWDFVLGNFKINFFKNFIILFKLIFQKVKMRFKK